MVRNIFCIDSACLSNWLIFSNNYTTVGAPFLGIEMGQIYFEVEIMNAVGAARVGFAGSAFRNDSSGLARGKAIGGDDVSWSTYSVDGLGRHRCTRDSFAKMTSPLQAGSLSKSVFGAGTSLWRQNCHTGSKLGRFSAWLSTLNWVR
jgi:hypothetical protein